MHFCQIWLGLVYLLVKLKESYCKQYKTNLLLIYKNNPFEMDLRRLKSLSLKSSFHTLCSDTVLELEKIEKQNSFKICMFTRSA